MPLVQRAAMARPSDYRPEFARHARMACRAGASNQDLARLLSVGLATVYRWLARHADFAAAVATGRAQAAAPIRRSLYQRAIGGEYLAERVFHVRGSDTPIVARYRRRILADPQAAFRWLDIRRPDEWRIDTKVEVEKRRHAAIGALCNALRILSSSLSGEDSRSHSHNPER